MAGNEKNLVLIDEAARLEGVSPKSIRRWIERGLLSVTKIEGRGPRRKGHQEIRIHFSQLSPEAQAVFLEGRQAAEPTEKEPGKALTPNLTPKQKEAVDRKLRILAEYGQLVEASPRGELTLATRRLGKRHGCSYKSIRVWAREYQSGGYKALIPDWHSGQRHALIDKSMVRFIEKEFLKPFGPPLKEVHEKLSVWCDDRNRPTPSYRTVANFIAKKWPKSQQLLFRDKEEWNRRYSPYVRRDWAALRINECWCSDHKQLDVFCLWRGRAVRPWVTLFEDLHTKRYVGWVVCVVPNSLAIGQAFCNGCRQVGPPADVLTDRGKDYKAYFIAGRGKKRPCEEYDDVEADQVFGIMRELGCEVTFAAPRNPREKPIEPSFNFFGGRTKGWPGYCANAPKKRPKKLTREIKTGKLLSFEDLTKKVDEIIVDRNARPHSTTGVAPNAFYEKFVPAIPSEELLSFLLMDVTHPKVRDSTVSLNSMIYRSDELWRLAGERVECRRDPQDLTRAVIIYQGKIFCQARLEVPDHFKGPLTAETVKECRRIRKQVNKYRKFVLENEDVIDDPLRVAVQLENEGKTPQRDVRPASSKVRAVHLKERIARDAVKALKEEPNEEISVAAQASFGARLAAAFNAGPRQAAVKKPRARLVKCLSYDGGTHEQQ